MNLFSTNDFNALAINARTIESDKFGPKVLLCTDGSYLKLFRRKRLLSSALWYPYAARFVENSALLLRLGIPAPRVIAVYRVATPARDIVHYAPVPGDTLRHLFCQQQVPEQVREIREKLATFVRHLFDMGIYFRSLHLGNIVLLPDGTLGLIDVSDLRHKSMPLRKALRQRNVERIKRLCKPGEIAWFDITTILLPIPPRRPL